MFQPFLKGVDAVRLANAKLQPDAGSAALKLMDCLFSTSEMVNCNPSGVTRSKDETRQRTIRPLDHQKMRYIDGTIPSCICLNCIAIFSVISSNSPREMGCYYG